MLKPLVNRQGVCKIKTMMATAAARFRGKEGRQRLIQALRLQQIVADELALATELSRLARLITFDEATPRNIIISQGKHDTDIYLIVSGRVSVRVNGREVANRKAGQHVGEMALIDPRAHRSATVVATEPSVLAKITEPYFTKLAKKYPQLWRRLAIELAERLRQRSKFHTPPNEKPNIFIGSSVENLPIAQQIQTGLAHDPMLVQVWTDGVFGPAAGTMDNLFRAISSSDFAVLVLAPEDTVISRKKKSYAPRDNCVFELGLFMGALGGDRVFIVKQRGANIKMPTDLLGITPAEYVAGDTATLAARIAPVCTEIRQAIQRLGPK